MDATTLMAIIMTGAAGSLLDAVVIVYAAHRAADAVLKAADKLAGEKLVAATLLEEQAHPHG